MLGDERSQRQCDRLVENNLKAVYEFDPFGKPLRVSEPEEELNPFRFSTKYTDAETGLCYYGYRYYDAVRGRWINRDPIGEQGGPNLQAVVRNKIVNEWDYLGLREDIPAGADKPITYTDKVENAKQRNQYWEYLQDSEQSRAIFDEAVYDPPASGITPDKKSYDAGSYGCCTRAKIAEGKAALKKAFMESGIDPKTFRSEHGIQPSCYNCNKVLSSFMKCGSCWSCFMENRRWKREGVKDHWVVTCYAVGSSGIVVDRAIFDKTGGQTDVESFRKTWDLLWDIEDTGLWKAPRPCPKL